MLPHSLIYIHTASVRICKPLIVSRSLRSLANYKYRNLYGEANSVNDSRDIHAFVAKLQKNSALTQASNSAYKSAFRRLSGIAESRISLPASEAPGEAGITGSSHPHMLPLFMFATRLPHTARQQQRRGWR